MPRYTETRVECAGGCRYGFASSDNTSDAAREENRQHFRSVDLHEGYCGKARERSENLGLIHEYIFDKPHHPNADEVFDAVWALQDGYGVAGFTPPQGFDWSGIRDSEPETVKAMAHTIRRIVGINA